MKERLRKTFLYSISAFALCAVIACSSSDSDPEEPEVYIPTPKPLTVPPILARLLPPPIIPADNPQTEEGITLGRKLFFDPILSGDGTQSCASCHQPEHAFTDPLQFSVGIDGESGTRNSMPIFNLAWNRTEKFFWDGRAISVEDQALQPVTNPIEMHNTWENAVNSLENDAEYPELFRKAFGTKEITKELAAKAIAQFERILISANSPFDKYLLGEGTLSESELNGFEIFMDESRGDCFHCHGNENSPLWTDNIFHNNGLDENFTDKGLSVVTGDPNDDGKFKSPSLRNLAYSAPYMHDGSIATLESVVDYYNRGGSGGEHTSDIIKPLQLTQVEQQDLVAFLKSLSQDITITVPKIPN